MLIVTAALPLTGQARELAEDDKLSLITRLTAGIIASNHYRQHPLNNQISSQIFDEYFKYLDPSKMYFTQDDVKSFEKYRFYLDDLIQAGNNEFAFKVYELYVKRLAMYRQYCEKRLSEKFDFTQDESFVIDRTKAPRAANMEELQGIWDKKLKNDLLYFRLMKRAMAEESKTAKDGKSAKKDNSATWDNHSPEEKIKRRLRDISNEIAQKDKYDILGMFLTCMAQTYGPHSSYLSPREENDFDIAMKLSLFGIGAVLTSDDGYTKVVKIVPGGPAAKDGRLKEEDKIIAVTQEGGEPVDIIDMSLSNVVNIIRGPEKSKVTLSVLSGKKGGSTVPQNITLVRDKVELKSSEASGVIKSVKHNDGTAGKIGVITLPNFYMDFQGAQNGEPEYKSSTRDVKKILDEFNKDNIDGLIVDMRSNGGGSLAEAITLSGLFIEKGPIVQIRQSNRDISTKYDPDTAIHYKGPMIVLINKLTSSAAEIFTGAMKDYRRAIIIGDSRTYGKGTVLDVVQLARPLSIVNQDFPAGSVKFESAVFYRANGSSTQQLGITPDVIFPSITESMKIGEIFSENHLPWDAIKEVPHDIYDKNIEKMLPELQKKSAVRTKNDNKYRALKENIDIFNKYKDRTTVSLNEEKRWIEYDKEKKVFEEQEKLLPQDEKTDKKDKSEENDFLIDESINILYDYIKSSGKKTSVAQRGA
ncbi:MAG: carboxy terminal-processing peptidase [Victivallaceae bacterium]